MPQDFNIESNGQPMNPQKLKAMQDQARQAGEVFPYDTKKVYATEKLVKARSIPEVTKVGHELEVHSAVADKLVSAGKATLDKPKEEKPKV
jgi:hypothetical protein